MNVKGKMPKLPKINGKLFISMILIIIIGITIVKFIPGIIFKSEKEVVYMVLDKEQIPDKIHEIIPKYKMLERALAARVDDQIYVIVTRGEKLTAGYGIDIERMEIVNEEDEVKLVVHAIFKDPKPDDIVSQSMTHPYVVAMTELKEFPDKINLEIKYGE